MRKAGKIMLRRLFYVEDNETIHFVQQKTQIFVD